MITEAPETVLARGEKLLDLIRDSQEIQGEVVESEEQVGGGSAPSSILRGYSVKLESRLSPEKLECFLRKSNMPIIGRVVKGNVYLDMRTVTDEEVKIIADSIMEIDRRYCR